MIKYFRLEHSPIALRTVHFRRSLCLYALVEYLTTNVQSFGCFSLTVHFHYLRPSSFNHFDRPVNFVRLSSFCLLIFHYLMLRPSTFADCSIKVMKTAQFNLKRPSTLDRVKLIHFNLNFKLTRLLANLRELNHGMNQMKNNDQKMLQLLLNKSKNLLASTPSILQFDENIKQEYESY